MLKCLPRSVRSMPPAFLMVITTPSGLYAYAPGDVVRFVFDEDVQPGGFNVVRQHGGLPPEPGAPLGGSNNHVDIAFAAAR